jgi:ferredoxin
LADVEVVSGQCLGLQGYLGAFQLQWQSGTALVQAATFDLVLDLQRVPAFAMPQPPQGYFHAADGLALDKALTELPEMVGEFEKPKFFAYKESICAHSRSRKTGCNNCIDVCSTRAISANGDHVKVDPHLCMGCGACATVCPSGAMSYQYPRVADRGAQFRAMLAAYRAVPGANLAAPTLLFHNAGDGRSALLALGAGRGLPAQLLPIETWHVAAIGLDLLLGAFVYGAAGVALLAAGSETPEYAEAVRHEMQIADTLLNALGFSGRHFHWVDAGDAAQAETQLWSLPPVASVARPALFHLSNDKRGSLEFIIDHLLAESPLAKSVMPMEIALPAGSLYGRVNVDVEKCTLCLACAGACPESALMDGADYPRLKFLERNCVQCGLCEQTCPEQAITLTPRLLLTDARKREVVLNESEPFHCIACGEVLGTRQMIDRMLGKLAGHSMFAGEGKLKRLQMCADCRVVDMMSNQQEYSILTGKPLE